MEDALFIASKIFWGIARPGNFLILLAALGLVLVWLRRRRTGTTLLTCGIGGLLAVMVLPVEQVPLRLLEGRFPTVRDFPAHVDGIVTLGGAVDPFSTERYGMPSLNEAAERLTYFVALARRYPDARLIYTGGNGSLGAGGLTEERAARELFAQLGLSGRDIVYENRSRNTYENAIYTRELARPKPGETWLLVTSASHMPRAVGVFRHAGWDVVPVPVAYKAGAIEWLLPGFDLGGQLRRLDMALHEWVGLVAYRLLGRTDSLFPAP